MLETFFDHRHFYINEKPFYPIISSDLNNEDANTTIISIDCSNKSTLEFNRQLKTAEVVRNKNKYIIWDIQLDLENPNFPLEDELFLQSILHSINYFVNNIYTLYQDISIGIILYSGSIPQFELKGDPLENWLKNLSTQQQSEFSSKYLKQLFSCDLLANYLRLIAPNIPDELAMMIRFDVAEIKSFSELMHLLSKERFEYFLLALKGSKVAIPAMKWESGEGDLGQIDCENNLSLKTPSNVGICFISPQKITQEEFIEFDNIFDKLSSLNISYRSLEEAYATEQWDGLDYIIVRKASLSSLGIRMLQGFYAASGIAVYHDLPIGIENEISFKYFLDTILH